MSLLPKRRLRAVRTIWNKNKKAEKDDQLMNSVGMDRHSPRILSLTIEVLFETPFVQPSPGHSTCQSRARPGRCMPSGLALCQVKRQYVCKQLTIERRDENSNGTP